MTWAEIAKRATDATGPDRQFDWTVMVFADGKEPTEHRINGAFIDQVPRYTASVDAMLALMAEKLPKRGHVGFTLVPGRGGAQAFVEHAMDPCAKVSQSTGSSAPLALLAAFSLAMEAEEASQGKEGERG